MLRLRALILFLTLLVAENAFASDKTVIKIASGSILEGYYSIGLKVCRMIKKDNSNLDCLVIPTNGSIDSLEQLKNGEVDFAFVGQNLALDAFNGTGTFSGKSPQANLVQLLKLHNDVFTVIVKDDDNILMFENLGGKKISNGPANSDSAMIYEELISHHAIKDMPDDIEILHEEYANKFCSGQVDAIIMMTGHPNALVSHIVNNCNCEFVQLRSEAIQKLIDNNPSYSLAKIGKDYYENIAFDQPSIAVPAIFVTKDSVDQGIISKLLKNIRNNIGSFKNSHPVLYDLPDDHFEQGFILPSALKQDINTEQ